MATFERIDSDPHDLNKGSTFFITDTRGEQVQLSMEEATRLTRWLSSFLFPPALERTESIQETILINQARARQEARLQEYLEQFGVQFTKQHFTGDSSFPTEYTIHYRETEATGPTFDLTLVAWIEKLLKMVNRDEATAYRAMETALRLLSANISHLQTELLVVKGMVAALSEEHPSS